MRREDQLFNNVLTLLYMLGTLSMLYISFQNYRYGLFPLVYSSSSIAAIFAALAACSVQPWDKTLLNRVSIWALVVCMLLVLGSAVGYASQALYWAFPLTLLCFIALHHKHAMVMACATGAWLFIALWQSQSLLYALGFGAAYSLLTALASTFARLQQQQNRNLVELEVRVPNTKAYNFRHFEDTLSKELSRADQTGKALSLIALEIDYFPQLIEVHGSMGTNNVLTQLSESLHATIRAGDSQYFDGKYTFYLLLPTTPSEGVVVIAERIRRAIEEDRWPVVDSMTISLGCTSYIGGSGNVSAQDFIDHANVALIEAQKNGHNRVCHN